MFLFYLHECFKFLERKGFPGRRPRDDDIKTRKVWGDWKELLVNEFLHSSGDQRNCSGIFCFWDCIPYFFLSGSIPIPMMVSCVEADPVALQLQKTIHHVICCTATDDEEPKISLLVLAISGIWEVPDPLPAASGLWSLIGSVSVSFFVIGSFKLQLAPVKNDIMKISFKLSKLQKILCDLMPWTIYQCFPISETCSRIANLNQVNSSPSQYELQTQKM